MSNSPYLPQQSLTNQYFQLPQVQDIGYQQQIQEPMQDMSYGQHLEGVYNENQLPIGKQLGFANLDFLNTQKEYYNNKMDLETQNQNSFGNQYVKPFATGMQALSSIGNIYLGFKQLGIAKKQLSLASDQWREQKQELNRIRSVRSKITKQYNS